MQLRAPEFAESVNLFNRVAVFQTSGDDIDQPGLNQPLALVQFGWFGRQYLALRPIVAGSQPDLVQRVVYFQSAAMPTKSSIHAPRRVKHALELNETVH
jgi:hypothetical protein